MTKLIHKYLSQNFILKSDNILPKENTVLCYRVNELIENLSKVFSLTKKQLKYYIKGWILKQDRNFDFKKFWSPVFDIWDFEFPMFRQVEARLMAMDSVGVQPMQIPRGLNTYLNPITGIEVSLNGRFYPSEAMQISSSELAHNLAQHYECELIHENNNSVTRVLRDWTNLYRNPVNINELY